MAKKVENAVLSEANVGDGKNILESFGIRHNGRDLVRVRVEYPLNSVSGTVGLIKDKVIEYAKTKLKDQLLPLFGQHTDMRAKYSFSIKEKSISESIFYVDICTEFATNLRNEPIQKKRYTYLYSIKGKRFILPQYHLVELLCEADKKRQREIYDYLRRRGEWFIKRDELYAYENGKSRLLGKLCIG